MAKIFDKLGMSKPRSSAFDLSREQKLTFKFGELVPTYLEEVVPGDQFRVKTESLIRLPALLAPVMHRVNVYLHYFYVPNRIVWNDWEYFITGVDPTSHSSTAPVMPRIRVGGADAHTIHALADYFGIPPSMTNDLWVSQLPFRAYQKIWQEYYADQNLDEKRDLSLLANQISGASYLRRLEMRNWEKDYLTSALPFAQRGDSVGVNADIDYASPALAYKSISGNPAAGNLGVDDTTAIIQDQVSDSVRIENINDIGIDINELRKSSAIQRWLEKSARGGGRYIETILAHFGVKSDDARLQRPEYLGGGRQPVVISEVLNTTGTTEAPQGDMAGHGISAGVTNSFSKYFNEHGYVMGIMSVMPKPAYMQGVARHFKREDKLDYYWPEFANLGEQEVKNFEVYADQTPVNQEGAFGYQQRYAEYKYGQSSVHGQFRTSLDFWHLARKFSSAPALNDEFIRLFWPEVDRIFAVSGEPQVIAQLYHDVKARRPMPFFSDPKLS